MDFPRQNDTGLYRPRKPGQSEPSSDLAAARAAESRRDGETPLYRLLEQHFDEFEDEDTPYRELCRMRWAALIKRVYETDPLCCLPPRRSRDGPSRRAATERSGVATAAQR